MAPGFFGLFSRRDSSKTPRKANASGSPRPRPKSPAGIPPTSTAKDHTSPSIADNSETLEGSQLSLETDYVLADADSPPVPSTAAYPLASSSSANGASSSHTKLKMPFRRKQSTSSKLSTTTTQSSVPPVPPVKEHHKFSIESSLSDSPSLRPPPSRSVIFGSYADPNNALSTRSLPQDSPFAHERQDSADTARNYETMSNPDSHMPSYAPLHPAQAPTAPTPTSLQSQSSSALTPPPPDSFNLKSFRHITSSLSTPPNLNPDSPPLDSLDPPVRPRPRGDSFASDSSQRISVAAFREVQARRSATNSPVPSLPGDRDSGVASGQVRSSKRSSTLGTPPPLPNTGSQPRLPVPRGPPMRSSTAPLFLSAGMTSSESSEEEESDSDEEEATLRPNRKRTVTRRPTGVTQSELGHRTSPVTAFSSARSDVGHGVHSGSPSRPASSAQHSPNLEVPGRTSRGSSVYSRTRASVSASALVPDAAANRASMISKHSVASKLTQPTRTQSRASTSSEEESSSSSSSSSQSSSEDAPLASLLPPPRPGSATSRASRSPARRPTKPLIDIGELVGGSVAPPIRTPEQSKDSSQAAAKEDSPLMRPRKTSFGIGERLSALASGISGSQPSRPRSPESTSDSKDEAFTPPAVPDIPRSQSPALSTRTSPPPHSQTRSASPALRQKGTKSSPGIHLRSSGGFQIDTSPLKLDSTFLPSPSSSASSDAPIPHITPTPIRERQEPPAFTVTSRPTSHATNPSVGTLAALDKAIAEANSKQGPRPAASFTADQARSNQQRQPQQQQQDPQATVRVVRGVLSKPSREESLPVPRPQQRPRVASAGVTVSNIRVTPPPSSASSSPSVARYGASSGPVVPLPKPFAIRDSSPASSAGESSSSRMPVTPRDGSELGVSRPGRPGRPGPGHRKRASVTFVDEVEANERDARRSSVAPRPSHGPAVVADSSDEEAALRNRERQAEEKRKERRRGEAKAAIELGKVINGPGPIDDDDDDNDDDDEDDDRPMNVPPRMSMAMGMNRNVPFPSAVSSMGFQGQWTASSGPSQPFANQVGSHSMQNLLGASAGAGMGLGGGMNMAPGMNMNLNMGAAGMGMVDPRMLVAHQQAMMIAKQTYQLAVAQQAMRDAADEWERGSAISGWGGGGGRSSIASQSVLGMGMNMGMNMNGNLGVNSFGMPPGAWPAGGGGGSAARSMYAGSMYAASEIGVPGGGGGMGWSTTNSVYGESFGAPRDRSSRAFRQGQAPQHGPAARESGGGTSGATKREGTRQRTKTAPSSGGGQQLRASAGAGVGAAGGAKRRGEQGLIGTVSPPSSWKGAS
ncbi:hypothetical protein BJY52DRAFT_1189510 [Lactarius psammicola]|nr:hypothetical protein BJY52DRAFT_1189510 [Lactarius psammicola]